jgi:hypothetical protein
MVMPQAVTSADHSVKTPNTAQVADLIVILKTDYG